MFACRPLSSGRQQQQQQQQLGGNGCTPAGATVSHSSSAFSSSYASRGGSSGGGGRGQSAAAAAAAATASAATGADSDMQDAPSPAAPSPWFHPSSLAAPAAAAACASPSSAAPAPGPSPTRSGLRLSKDLTELAAHKFTAAASTRISFPEGQRNLRRFQVLLTPHTGLYARASFLFTVAVPQHYPFQPPRVRCHTPVLHPNFNWRTGQVYLHILKNEWKPVLSINAVIFALQLLFLEPWPSAAQNALTAPAHTRAASAGSGSGSPPPGALSLASSKSATACSLLQLDEASILNLELYALIQAGERAEFESLVRRSLDGGFLFGHQWLRNRGGSDDEESDDEEEERDGMTDSDVEEEPRRGGGRHPQPRPFSPRDARLSPLPRPCASGSAPFDLLLQRVEDVGRQAHVSLALVREASECKEDSALVDGADGAAAAAVAAAAPVAAPSPRAPRRQRQDLDGRLKPGSDASGTPRRRMSALLRRKRAYCKMSPCEEHVCNPAADVAAEVAPASPSGRVRAEAAPSLHKRARSEISAPASAPQLRCTARTSRHRVIYLRRISDDLRQRDPASASRKRNTPPAAAVASISDGEYEPDDRAHAAAAAPGACGMGARDELSLSLSQQGRSSSAPRRRRAKKQYQSAALLQQAGSMEEDDALTERELQLINDVHAQLGMGGDAHPRPSSTVLPDLASFASFHPVSPPLAVAAAAAAAAAAACTAAPSASSPPCLSDCGVGSLHSHSPKRNVSDAQGVSIVPALTLDAMGARYGAGAGGALVGAAAAAAAVGRPADDAQASFILHGRSSSRSINMFGAVKAMVSASAEPVAGLADLHELHASLPAPIAMSD